MTPALLAPAALGLLVLVAGPLLAHLARRRPQDDVPYGAMLLLQRLQQLQRRRQRVQDLPLLILRLIALLAVILAVAGPELRWPGDPRDGGPRGPVVFLIDDSLSMDLRPDGGEDSLAARARAELGRRLAALPEGTRAGIVSVGSPALALTPELTADPGALQAAFAQVRQGQGATDLAGALRLGRRLLDGAGGTLVVLTDEAGPVAVEAARSELDLLARQEVGLEPVVFSAEAPANLHITEAEYGEGLEGGSVRLVVVNHGVTAAEVPLVVELPGGVEITTFVEVAPRSSAEERVTVPRSNEGGVGIARLRDPALPADDVFAFHLPRVGASRVLVVDGDPGHTAAASEVYFLERALAPWGPAGGARGGVRPEITTPVGISTLDPAVHRVAFLANVSDPAPLLGELAPFLQAGGGLVISLGDNVTADAYNAALGGILPGRLGRVVPLGGDDRGAPTALPDTSLPLFKPFSRGGRASFGAARWRRLFEIEPVEGATVLLRTEAGVPLLLERSVGRGRVLLLTGTIDLGWGDLCLQSAFMPLIQRLVGQLGGQAGGAGERLVGQVGAPLRIPLGGAVDEVSVTGPDGPVPTQRTGDSLSFTPAKAGAYAVELPGAPPLAWVAVNTDPVESDVQRGPGLLAVAAEVAPEAFVVRLDLSRPLLWAALGLLLLQGALAWWRDRAAPPAEEPDVRAA
ncbi:MAG: hypothetical protein RL071_2318 [Pseudomonadota bacterium]